MKLVTENYMFDHKGRITFFDKPVEDQPILKLVKVLRICTAHARRKHYKKPVQWRYVPTLTEVVHEP